MGLICYTESTMGVLYFGIAQRLSMYTIGMSEMGTLGVVGGLGHLSAVQQYGHIALGQPAMHRLRADGDHHGISPSQRKECFFTHLQVQRAGGTPQATIKTLKRKCLRGSWNLDFWKMPPLWMKILRLCTHAVYAWSHYGMRAQVCSS
jgi:hypothetical protein